MAAPTRATPDDRLCCIGRSCQAAGGEVPGRSPAKTTLPAASRPRRYAEPVGTDSFKARTGARGPHDLRNHTGADRAQRGRTHRNTARQSLRGLRRSYATNAVPTSTGREPIVSVPLPANQQLAAAPVEIVKAYRRDLPGAQPQTRQQQQDRIVTPAGEAAAIAAGQ